MRRPIATRLGNRTPEFARGLNPFVDDFVGVRHGFGVGLPIGHATGQLRHFDDETVVFFAPVNDQFANGSSSISILYTRYGFACPPTRGCDMMIVNDSIFVINSATLFFIQIFSTLFHH